MDKSKVALIRCQSYDEGQVYKAVKAGIDLIGGIQAFVKPKEKIVLKPNVLIGTDPQKCVTTHPAVFKAIGRLVKEVSAEVYCGDSPGFGKCVFNMRRANLKQAADELDIKIADFDNGRTVSHKNSLLAKQFTLANGILESDGVISLPKLKAHGLMRFTGAIKNQFGCVPGTLKGQFHLKLPDPYDFATMLADLTALVKPRLYIMDGIIAMEGNGPRSGKPRQMNVLLFSRDPVALDSIACKIIDLDPEFVPTSMAGEKAGLGTYHYDRIEVVGDSIDSFIANDFDVIREPPASATGGRVRTFFKNQICPRPVIDKAKCTRCGTCIEVCPSRPVALDWVEDNEGKFPDYNYDQCLRCFCCQELCPEGAITAKNTPLGNIISR